MKKIYFGLLLGICFSFQLRIAFFYEYKFISDSTDKTDVKKEIMLLDIDKSGSKYYSQDKFIADSISKADLEKQLKQSPQHIKYQQKRKTGDRFLIK